MTSAITQFVAQIPGADEAIQSAAKEGWVAVLLVVLVLSGFVCFGYMFRQVLNDSRERERTSDARKAELEDFIRTKLVLALESQAVTINKMLGAAEDICKAAADMTRTIDRFSAIMELQPCVRQVHFQRTPDTEVH